MPATSESFFSTTDRIAPSRGVVLTQNRRGRAYSDVAIARWLRYIRVAFKADQVDLVSGSDTDLGPHLETCRELGLSPSIRYRADGSTPDFGRLRALGVEDAILRCVGEVPSAWLEGAQRNQLPVRISAPVSSLASLDPEALSARGVVRVELDDASPLDEPEPKALSGRDDRGALSASLKRFEAAGIEVNVLGTPYCSVGEGAWQNVAMTPQRARDHGQYVWGSYALALKFAERAPWMMAQALEVLLARERLHTQPTDNILLPWLIGKKYAHFSARAIRRLTRSLRLPGDPPPASQTPALSMERVEEELAQSWRPGAPAGPCVKCRMRRICDFGVGAAEGITPEPIAGEPIGDPMHFCRNQPKYYTTVERVRLSAGVPSEALTTDALDTVRGQPASAVINPGDYKVENGHFDLMEGGVKWWSLSREEKRSTALPNLSPPFTVAFDVGGGIADYAGFAFGRHGRLLAPMTDYRHEIVLHVAADGRYVLLRDGHAVRPAEFESACVAPLRIGERVQPRIALWNIDESIATHNVRIWERGERLPRSKSAISIVIVSTRFTRRLQAVLHNLAHQDEIGPDDLEVLVAYVPGIDATDDVLDSMALAYPELRIVRMPFPDDYHQSKGFLINETVAECTGDWVVLLDSDTLVPPTFIQSIARLPETVSFAAPDGRKMLPPEVTAKILLGDLRPWEQWDALVNGPGEFRHRETKGVPVGFCQCVRRRWLEELPYIELEHFENADMWFALQLRDRIGPEHRLSGMPVVHLDHGGSQWYGTRRHL